jgi:hypothetical protein
VNYFRISWKTQYRCEPNQLWAPVLTRVMKRFEGGLSSQIAREISQSKSSGYTPLSLAETAVGDSFS